MGKNPLAFYTVAATLIPLLFITLVYQAKALDPTEPREHLVELIVALLVVCGAIIGESAALKVLAAQHPTQSARQAVELCVIGLGGAVALITVSRAARPFFDKVHAAFAVLVAIGMIVALVVAGRYGASLA